MLAPAAFLLLLACGQAACREGSCETLPAAGLALLQHKGEASKQVLSEQVLSEELLGGEEGEELPELLEEEGPAAELLVEAHLPLCHSAIVQESCRKINGGLDASSVSRAQVQGLLSLNGSSATALWSALGLGEDVACESLCMALLDYIGEPLPPSSDVACYFDLEGQRKCDLDVSPQKVLASAVAVAPGAGQGHCPSSLRHSALRLANAFRIFPACPLREERAEAAARAAAKAWASAALLELAAGRADEKAMLPLNLLAAQLERGTAVHKASLLQGSSSAQQLLTAVWGCEDKAPPQFSFTCAPTACSCAKLKGYCNDDTFGSEIRAQCPSTCGACTRPVVPTQPARPVVQVPSSPTNPPRSSCSEGSEKKTIIVGKIKYVGTCQSYWYKQLCRIEKVKEACPISCGVCYRQGCEDQQDFSVDSGAGQLTCNDWRKYSSCWKSVELACPTACRVPGCYA